MVSKEEFLAEEGIYEFGDDGIIWIHLSPIPNWYHILRSLKFTCPFCGEIEKDFIVDVHRSEDNYRKRTKENHEHQHREVTFTCKCGQTYGIENFDHYRGEYQPL